MDIQAECRSVESKLRNFIYPAIFINPDIYDSADTRAFVLLIRKIANSLPIELHEILIEEGIYTPLTTFQDEQFYSVFADFVNKYAKKVDKTTSFTILPYEQWRRKYFCAMKMRLVGVFVDVLKGLQRQRQLCKIEENYCQAKQRIDGRAGSNALNNYLLEKTLQNYIIVGPEFISMQQKILDAIERQNAVIKNLCAKVEGVEGLVKNLYVQHFDSCQ